MKEKIIYYVAGSGEEKDNLEKLTINLGLNKFVHFLGFCGKCQKYLTGS
jgi:hypothetical protein